MDILSNLCSVCHANAPKYKCPRCSTQTCSLTCVQRHKQRAECSGIRDPTKFLKKAQLQTEAGFDHDFNFISKLEREATRDEDNIANRGLDGTMSSRRAKRRAAFYRALRDRQTMVHRAPVGMTREKQNCSEVRSVGNEKELFWTIEWILEDGSRRVVNANSENQTLEAAFNRLQASHPSIAGQSKKRKRGEATQATEISAAQGVPSSLVAYHSDDEDKEDREDGLNSNSAQQPADEDGADSADSKAKQHPVDKDEADESGSHPTQVCTKNPVQDITSLDNHDIYFYLVKPRTTGDQRVLIKVQPNQALRSILHHQEILEFPTFQILSHHWKSLPEAYILDLNYNLKLRLQEEEMKRLLDAEGHSIEDRPVDELQDGQQGKIFNANDVLEILRRDVA